MTLAYAHPGHMIGSAMIHPRSLLHIETDTITIEHEVVFGNIASLQKRINMDWNKDGLLSAPEKEGYLQTIANDIKEHFILELNSKPLPLHLVSYELDLGDERILPLKSSITVRFQAFLKPLGEKIHHLFFYNQKVWGPETDYFTSITFSEQLILFDAPSCQWGIDLL
jgi:hypothetical protein